ncbi:MAG TPA: hypothetical protein VK169_04755 [Saprospiraceae bacterium]|nr:hypothetical protein [Saprospiraceae bacterium]
MQDKKFWNDWTMVIMASLTLGLAPFVPEPHIWGKIRWIAGGAEGMSLMDWGDFFMHGIPWMLLIRLIVLKTLAFFKPEA